jgi:C-terminal processing protease CtpA/Prc
MIFTLVGCRVNNDKPSNESNNDNNKQLTEKEKLDDFEYMYTILKDNYPFFEVNKRLNGVDWLAKKDDYMKRIKATPNDESFYSTMNVILSDIHNGHTSLVDKDFYSTLRTSFEKDYEYREAWLKQMNNPKTIERYSSMKEKEDSISSEEDSSYKKLKTMDLEKGKVAYISIYSFLDPHMEEDMKIINPYLDQIKNYKALVIDIRNNSGGNNQYWISIVKRLISKPVEYNYYMAFRGGDFQEQFIKNAYGFGYEKLEPISNIDKEKLTNMPPELKEDFKYYYKATDTIEPKETIGFKGKIYLLVDGHNFSSSEQFANFSKSTGFATLVGEKTKGDGIGFQPAVCSLPNSGYILSFPEEMGLNPDGSCDFEVKTEPDIVVPAQVNADISKDEAIQTVLKLIN